MDNSLTLPAEGHTLAEAPLPLSLPSVDQPLRYAWNCTVSALAGLWGAHRLRPKAARSYSARVRIGARQARRWQALFDVPARATALVPLQRHSSVGKLLQAHLLTELGLQRRHLVHLRHRTTHHAPVALCAKARDLRLDCSAPRILRLGEDRALVQLHTRVLAADGQLLSVLDDDFVVKALPLSDLQTLPSDPALLRDLLGLRRRLPQLCASDERAQVSKMQVPLNMGWRYGAVAGELRPSRTCPVAAWLLGLQRPCLQDGALRNLVVRHLAEMGRPLEQLSLTFASRAHLGQRLLLVACDAAFEVHDAQGRLVAFGNSGPRG